MFLLKQANEMQRLENGVRVNSSTDERVSEDYHLSEYAFNVSSIRRNNVEVYEIRDVCQNLFNIYCRRHSRLANAINYQLSPSCKNLIIAYVIAVPLTVSITTTINVLNDLNHKAAISYQSEVLYSK